MLCRERNNIFWVCSLLSSLTLMLMLKLMPKGEAKGSSKSGRWMSRSCEFVLCEVLFGL